MSKAYWIKVRAGILLLSIASGLWLGSGSVAWAADTTPPVISNIQVTDITTTGAAITWTTNEPCKYWVVYGVDVFANNAGSGNLSSVTNGPFSQPLTGLSPATTYQYIIDVWDASSNHTQTSVLTFTTLSPPDTTPPVISNIQASVTSSTATISWTTNEPASSWVKYGYSAGNYDQPSVLDSALITSHSQALSGLASNITYHYQVISVDAASNVTSSADQTLTTSPPPNSAPSVDAGSSQTVTLPNMASLDGTVSDDGRPNGTLSVTWTMDSGPGTVIFGNAASVDTTASFSLDGTYVLRLSASDGPLSNSDTMMVTVKTPNQRPYFIVDGGKYRTIYVGQPISFRVIATDPDGDRLTLQASLLSPTLQEVPLPNGATLNPVVDQPGYLDQEFRWTPPDTSQAGYLLYFVVKDSNSPYPPFSYPTRLTYPSTVVGEQRIIVILINFQNDPAQPITVADANDLVFNQVDAYFREVSYGKVWLSGQTVGWYTLPFNVEDWCSGLDRNFVVDAIKAADPDVDFTQYDHMMTWFTAKSEKCWFSGGSTLGKGDVLTADGTVHISQQVIFSNSTREIPPTIREIITHELGHGLGLPHANFLDCGSTIIANPISSCSSIEYGDYYDTMGSIEGHFNAVYKEQLGWLAPSNVSRVMTTGTNTYSLAPLELASSQLQALKLPQSISMDTSSTLRTWYVLDYRRLIGFDAVFSYLAPFGIFDGPFLHLGFEDGLPSLVLDATPGDFSTITVLPMGAPYADPIANLTITPTAQDNNGLTVQVTLDPDTTAPQVTIEAPANGTQLKKGPTIAIITKKITDNRDIIEVDCDVDGVSLGKKTDAPLVWPWDTAQASIGTHTITVKAKDADGNVGSASITLEVKTNVSNQAPIANAGADQEIATSTFPVTVSLDGTVSDDALPNPPGAVTTTWSVVSNLGDVTFGNASAIDTTVTLSRAGTYELRLGANDSQLNASDTVTIIVDTVAKPPSPPTNLLATATSTTQVHLSWTASPDAVDCYDVLRYDGQGWVSLGTTTNTVFDDTTASSAKAYLYKIRAVYFAANLTTDSYADLAMTILFSDDPLTLGTTVVKAQHITELRQAVNALQTLAKLPAISWTDSTLSGVAIKAVHLKELRDGINAAFQKMGGITKTWTDPSLSGIIIKAVHIGELRQAVK